VIHPGAPAMSRQQLPIWCTELELGGLLPAALQAPARAAYATTRVLVRLHGSPLGYVTERLVDGSVEVPLLVKLVDEELLDAVNAHLAADGVGAVGAVPVGGLAPASPTCPGSVDLGTPVTVVVCTRDRPEPLRSCLARLRALDYRAVEVLIVDNAPTDGATRAVFAEEVGDDARFRYVLEPRPGLSCARNRGLADAVGEVVLFTDDDVWVDPKWAGAVARAFASADVACVTGLVCAAAIDGPAELYFDARSSWADGCRPHVYRLGGADDDGLFPYSAGIFGTGANFAVRTAVMRSLGGFDEALGAGTSSGGGEDLDAFVRVLQAGYALAYEPAAVVWHHHRSDLDGLRRQLYGYGTGLSAFLTKHLMDPRTRWEVLRRIPRGLARLSKVPRATGESLGAEASEASVRPRGLLLREFGGFLTGPLLYLQARRALRAAGSSSTGTAGAAGAAGPAGEAGP
jgi:GT2 family glycosyltransferase